jgi:hypothetical protein
MAESASMASRKALIALIVLIGVAIGSFVFYAQRPSRIGRTIDPFPVTTTNIPSRGRFHGVAREGSGEVTVHELADGKRLIRFSDFATATGPEPRVYLVAASDATSSETVTKAGFLDLGPLKAPAGNQNYELRREADLNRYRAVTIWCRRLGLNFATAPLASSTEPIGHGAHLER